MAVLMIVLSNMVLFVIKVVIIYLYALIKIRLIYKLFLLSEVKQVIHLLCESVFGLLYMSSELRMSNLFSESTILTSQSIVSSLIMQQVSLYSKLISHLLVGTAN